MIGRVVHLCLLTALLASPSVEAKPLKVFILAGQSNMNGHTATSTIEHVAMDPATKPMYDAMTNDDGTPVVLEDVYIVQFGYTGGWGKTDPLKRHGKLTTNFGASNGDKIGPEFTFGIYLHEKLEEPFLIIKTAWGGKSLHTDFRSPSAGPFEWADNSEADVAKKQQKIEDTGISNKGYHYLGSAKILGGIGKGFAEAMAELLSAE